MDWRNIPSLAALRAFEAAARHGSFTKAAEELNVTQAAVAQHVRALEAEFAQTFVTRQGRGIAMTDAGRRLAERLRQGFEVIAEGVAELREANAARPLQISTTPVFAANWLMPRIGDFWAKNPDIQLNILPTETVIDLRDDGIDLAIRYGSGNWPKLDAELFTDGDFWVVGAPSLAQDRQGCGPGELQDLPWVLEERRMERHYLLEAAGVDLDTLDMHPMNSTDLVFSAVRAGLGMSLQHRSIVERDVERGELVKVCDLSKEGMGYYMVTIPGREPKGLRELKSWMRRQAAL